VKVSAIWHEYVKQVMSGTAANRVQEQSEFQPQHDTDDVAFDVNDNGCKGASVWLLRHTST
jgi:hypothetical protein